MTEALQVQRAVDLERQEEDRRWLIEGLWADQAVGVLGGEPKCCKSYLALTCAVAVASGTPMLRRFAVKKPGMVLLYAAEDAPHVVRSRLSGIAQAAGVDLGQLDIFVIMTPHLRLDLEADCRRLQATVARLQPRLLILDPFVRLHRADENVAQEVAPMLGYLRALQRVYGCGVMLVHHAKKGAAAARGGQALRGSSELHAWGDSYLYLRRRAKELLLSVEHRAAAGIESLALELAENAEGVGLALRVADTAAAAVDDDGGDEGSTVARVELALWLPAPP